MNSPLSPLSPRTPGTPRTPPATPRSARSRRFGGAGRSLLSQISESEDYSGEEGAGNGYFDQTSPSKLVAIPEAAAAAKEKQPPSPVAAAPVATQIHLRNGSIVTLTPPELTAWQPAVYLHGPIKLPKPTIMPRKNSVATLDPFQDAIERLYQDALTIPRRRSDDAVVDDICDFFDAFGFDIINFAGDNFLDTDFGIGEVRNLTLDTETFSTPPMEPVAVSPVEAIIANDMLDQWSRPHSPSLQAPPVENEETLRARGIARLSRNAAAATPDEGRPGRKESIPLSKPQTSAVLPLLPAPETSMLDAVLQPTSRNGSYSASAYSQRHPDGTGVLKGRDPSNSGVRVPNVDDGVEEMMSVTAASKEPKLSRMRRLVATASSIGNIL